MSRAERIKAALEERFHPQHLEVVDQSHEHAGHVGAGAEGETHFFVRVVSEAFEGQSPVVRQRAIYSILGEEMKTGLHALELRTLTPAEAERR